MEWTARASGAGWSAEVSRMTMPLSVQVGHTREREREKL